MKVKIRICLCLFICSVLFSACGDDDYDGYVVQLLGEWEYKDTQFNIETNNTEATQLLKDYINTQEETETGNILSCKEYKGRYYHYSYYKDNEDQVLTEGIYIVYEKNLSVGGLPGMCSIEMADSDNTLHITYDMAKNLSREKLVDLYRQAGVGNPEGIETKTMTILKTFTRKSK